MRSNGLEEWGVLNDRTSRLSHMPANLFIPYLDAFFRGTNLPTYFLLTH